MKGDHMGHEIRKRLMPTLYDYAYTERIYKQMSGEVLQRVETQVRMPVTSRSRSWSEALDDVLAVVC